MVTRKRDEGLRGGLEVGGRGGGGVVGIARCLNLLPLKFDIHCIHVVHVQRNTQYQI